MTPVLHSRPMQRVVVACIAAALMLLPLSGCVTPTAPGTVLLAGIVVDGARLARPGEYGLVRVTRGGHVLEAQPGMVLMRGDRIESGPSADVVIHYPSGSELLMRPGSSGRIGSLTEAVGEFFARIRGIFAIETEFVTAGAKGTSYLVRAQPDGAATVVVLEGAVEVGSTTGAWRPVRVETGDMAIAHRDRPHTMAASEGELQRIHDWVERVENLVPPPDASGVSGTTAAVGIGIAALIAAILVSRNRDRDKDKDRERPRDPQERDEPARQLAAPGDLRPGGPSARRPPRLRCSRPVTLRWDAVAGARDYVITMELQPPRGRWQRVLSTATRTPRTDTARGLNGLYRWWVQARDGNRLSPSSAVMYFNCSAAIVR